MKRIDVEQGSQSWLEFRQKRIMATDASIICGLNPYVTSQQLWADKLGLSTPEPPNEHMLRGQRLEPLAREIFNRETGIEFAPAVVEHDIHWWMGASLDGISSDGKTLLEIKCPGERNHLFSLECGILEYWQVQMQHQLMVTEADIAYFMSYNENFERGRQWIIYTMIPDFDFMKIMFHMEEDFYNINMCGMIEPVDDVKPLYKGIA